MTDLSTDLAQIFGGFAVGLTFGACFIAPRVGPWRSSRSESAPAPTVVVVQTVDHSLIPLTSDPWAHELTGVSDDHMLMSRAALEAIQTPQHSPRRTRP